MNHWLHRFLLEIHDRLRHAATLQQLAGFARLMRAGCTRPLPSRLERMADSYRLLLATGRPDAAEKQLRPFVEDSERAAIWREERIGWARSGGASEPGVLRKSLILKPRVSDREKGVLMIWFEYNIPPLLQARGIDALWRDYTVICATAWSPTHFPVYWSLAHLSAADVFFMISHARDAEWWGRLRTGTGVLPFLMSDWINPGDYQPRPKSERDIDILMVANWAPFKRHWLLFKALRQLGRKLRVVLVGQPEAGRTQEHVMREAEAFGVRDQIEFRNRLPIEEVTRLQCASKVSLIFSKREGSCVAVTESFFADTPVGLLRNSHIGSAAYINPQTGVFLEPDNLAAGLDDFLARQNEFEPRRWATANISCFESTRRMNTLLREHARQRGQEWTQDISVLGCRPMPCHVHSLEKDRLAPAYAEMQEKYGIRFS